MNTVKLLLITCIATLLLGLTGCSTNSDSSATNQTTAAGTEAVQTVTVANSQSETSANANTSDTPITTVSDTIAPSVQVQDLQSALTAVYEQANPSVVYIIVPPAVSGSGFVYSEDGYIVTNNHVVAEGRSYEVVFANGEREEATLVGSDVDSDLAVLKVDSLPKGVTPLALADPTTLRVGQFVVAIGNPFGEQGSMSFGIISGLGRSLASQRDQITQGSGFSSYSLPQVIQTDAPINPGNSGGPLLNLNGEVVGVNAAIASTTGVGSGVGFSIPVEALDRIIPRLIDEGDYTYPYIGAGFDNDVSLQELDLYGLNQTEGAYVVSVTPNSPADEAGLIAADPQTAQGGDLIVQIDDATINTFADLNAYLVFHTEVGDTIDITVIRDGKTVEVPLTLGARP